MFTLYSCKCREWLAVSEDNGNGVGGGSNTSHDENTKLTFHIVSFFRLRNTAIRNLALFSSSGRTIKPTPLGALFDANLYPGKCFPCAYDLLSQRASKHGQTTAELRHVLTNEVKNNLI
jgi:hypothetical protein